MFELAQSEGIIASIHCRPQHQAHIREFAKRFPRLTILLHHMGHPKVLEPEGLSEVLATARHDNVFVKVSGFYYSSAKPPWDYPLSDVQPVVNALYQRYGAGRLLWGSDYPVCRRNYITATPSKSYATTATSFQPRIWMRHGWQSCGAAGYVRGQAKPLVLLARRTGLAHPTINRIDTATAMLSLASTANILSSRAARDMEKPALACFQGETYSSRACSEPVDVRALAGCPSLAYRAVDVIV